MDHSFIINTLETNKAQFNSLLQNLSKEELLWRAAPEKWCLLEIICHLYDEEREDFRTRVKHTLENPDLPLPSIDPASWVKERHYLEQNFDGKLHSFLEEREQSVRWLKSLTNPQWKNTHLHPKFGPMSAEFFLANWLAHDYLHMRQIIAIKFQYLKFTSSVNLAYAGDW